MKNKKVVQVNKVKLVLLIIGFTIGSIISMLAIHFLIGGNQ